MDINLLHELSIVYQEPLFLVFLDLRKYYDNMDRGCLLKTLEEYRAGPNMRGILA